MRIPSALTLLTLTIAGRAHAQAMAAPRGDTLSVMAVDDTALVRLLAGVDVVGQMLNDSARAIVRVLAVRDERVVREGGTVSRRQTAERLYIIVTPFRPTEPVLVYAIAHPFVDQRRETLSRQRHPQFVLGYGPAGEAVEDLHALVKVLREEGCNVLEKIDDSAYGKFAWVIDPEGNKVELWQPPAGQ